MVHIGWTKLWTIYEICSVQGTFAIPILKNCFVNSNSISSSEENNKNKRKPYAYGDRMAAAAVATMRDILIELQGGPAGCTLHFVDIKKLSLCYINKK